MRWRDWLISVLALDGCLPLVALGAPTIIGMFVKNRDGVEFLSTFLAPLSLACIRAGIGQRQIERITGTRATVGRQILFAGAIVLLWFFESVAVALRFNRNAPPIAWWIAAGLYAGYLILVMLALRPPRSEPSEPLL